ncbi:MAG: GNAT family N-acetyltransferase [Ferruginibacter sp.]
MQTIIREAVTADFPAILTLIKEFAIFQKTPQKVTITLEEMENQQHLFKCFVAVVDEHIVGFASYYFAYYSWSGKALYLDDLYVKENYRKQKVGSLLLNAIIELAKKEYCRKMRWQVSKWNENAIGFYKQLGAYIDDTEINCDLILSNH